MEQPVEDNYFLTKDILVHIFKFLDRRTLVYNCRPVCKFWKEVIECSDAWETQIANEAKAYCPELEYILPKAHLLYPWYMCYVLCKNIFYKNLLLDCCCEDNLTHWSDEICRSTRRFISAPLEIDDDDGFTAAPQDLRDEGVTTYSLMSFGDCIFNQVIDLYRSGFTRKIFEFCPPIHISEWFAVGYTLCGRCHLDVTFLDSQWKCSDENGVFRYTKRLVNREWHKVSYTFTEYSPDVRYITIRHGVHSYFSSNTDMSSETWWFGKVAAKVAGAKLVIAIPELRAWANEYQL